MVFKLGWKRKSYKSCSLSSLLFIREHSSCIGWFIHLICYIHLSLKILQIINLRAASIVNSINNLFWLHHHCFPIQMFAHIYTFFICQKFAGFCFRVHDGQLSCVCWLISWGLGWCGVWETWFVFAMNNILLCPSARSVFYRQQSWNLP